MPTIFGSSAAQYTCGPWLRFELSWVNAIDHKLVHAWLIFKQMVVHYWEEQHTNCAISDDNYWRERTGKQLSHMCPVSQVSNVLDLDIFNRRVRSLYFDDILQVYWALFNSLQQVYIDAAIQRVSSHWGGIALWSHRIIVDLRLRRYLAATERAAQYTSVP